MTEIKETMVIVPKETRLNFLPGFKPRLWRISNAARLTKDILDRAFSGIRQVAIVKDNLSGDIKLDIINYLEGRKPVRGIYVAYSPEEFCELFIGVRNGAKEVVEIIPKPKITMRQLADMDGYRNVTWDAWGGHEGVPVTMWRLLSQLLTEEDYKLTSVEAGKKYLPRIREMYPKSNVPAVAKAFRDLRKIHIPLNPCWNKSRTKYELVRSIFPKDGFARTNRELAQEVFPKLRQQFKRPIKDDKLLEEAVRIVSLIKRKEEVVFR